MRFSLQDVKKQVQRRGDDLLVRLHFLRPGELHTEIAQLIGYYEEIYRHGEPHKHFVVDDARASIGDYRLAHCLGVTLSAWYTWRSRNWEEVLQKIGGTAPARLEEAAITSPVSLRLALFDVVNERFSGFLGTPQRDSALQEFAAQYSLSLPDLEYLLALDSDEEERLLRETPQPPTSQDVATQYNQWVFEAALFNASSVHFEIDCNAFERAQPTSSTMAGTGIGAVIKRLCFLARRLGVYYDLSYDMGTPALAPRLHLTLYGPQEMTGAPQQYGMRLARLCRVLLGYGIVPSRQLAIPGKQRAGGNKAHLLSSAIVQAKATVHFLQRGYSFLIDETVLSALPPVVEIRPAQEKVDEVQEKIAADDVMPFQINEAATSIFDSSIEQSFAEAFQALQHSHAVDGWQLIREPEPLLLEQGIFIPDFALTRDQQRIYMEILGFWTPAYRERKIQKLQQLQERNDIVLAIPNEARAAFAPQAAQPGQVTGPGLPPQYPVVWYDGQLSASELLQLMRSRYDDFAERLELIDVAELRQRVEQEGLLPESVCYELLHCYRRSELPLAAERVLTETIVFIAGIGLYSTSWMEQLRISFVEWIGRAGVLALNDVLRASRERWLALQRCEDATIEAILGLWPEVIVSRSSIFEATVAVLGRDGTVAEEVREPVEEIAQIPTPAKRAARIKSTGPKKRVVRETAQGDLWG